MKLSNVELLDFGIEIVAAMKASCYDFDIETGRILALQETEIDRMEEVTEIWDTLDDESKKRYTDLAEQEKIRLHKQAIFAAKISLEKLNNILAQRSKT